MYSPKLDDFLKLATQGNLIPVTRRILADFETPLSAYKKIHGQGDSFLFESVEGGEHLGRYSFVGCNPRAIIKQTGNRVEVIESGKLVSSHLITRTITEAQFRNVDVSNEAIVDAISEERAERVRVIAGEGSHSESVADGLEVVERVLARYRPVNVPGLPRFTGGAVGFIGYEFIHDVEPIVPRPPKDELGTPTLYFLIADELLIFDRAQQTISILVNAVLDDAASPTEAYENAVAEIDRLLALLERPLENLPATLPSEVAPAPFESNTPKDKFLANVLEAKTHITAGDVIQVVGSQRFSAPLKASPLDLYRAARTINPSPYMFLLELDGFALVGVSPEIHVRCEDRLIEIRPIAGTRPRGATHDEDLAMEKELLADPKERAEHVMLVDLARNDIGRVCVYGSVQVKELMVIERYSHVMHIVSQVEGKLAADKSAFDLMRATFPAGTVSGAPKIRAMQLIAEMEGTTRGPYAGCVGYFSFNGNCDTAITIRTALVKDGQVFIQAGGGWVTDSDPESEFQETVNKSKAMRKAVALAESFTS